MSAAHQEDELTLVVAERTELAPGIVEFRLAAPSADAQLPLWQPGAHIDVVFRRWLRHEQRFESVDALVEQLRNDTRQAAIVLRH